MCKACHCHETEHTFPACHCHHEEPSTHGGCHCHEHEENEEQPLWRALLPMMVSALLLLVGIFANPFAANLRWIVYVVAYLPIALPIFKEAIEEMGKGEVFNEFTLMLLATVGAFAIGEYPEAVAVLLFYAVGECFQDRAVGRARRDIKALVSLRPDTVTVVSENGECHTQQPEQVAVGSVIEVVAGGRVPLDGMLLTEQATFDTAALTGEAEPRSFTQGEEVAAGVIAMGRVVQLRVVRPYNESALQRILSMVNDAAARKAPAELFIRKFARIYTPIVIALALLIAVVPTLFVAHFSTWLYRALVFLVISCPCALVVSIPLAYFRGIGVASRMGILFKGGNYLDAVTHLTHVVFDKTGTLTTGTFAVTHVTAAPNYNKEQVIGFAAALESHSSHPIGRAIVAACHAKAQDAEQMEELSGLGLHGKVDGHDVLVGKADLLRLKGVDIPAEAAANTAGTAVHCAVDGQWTGTLWLSDEPRAEAAATISRLKQMGVVETCVLSGDKASVVEALANRVGADCWRGNLLPEGKVREMETMKARAGASAQMAFVGDGINDAPVMALSNVAFAMGGTGADAAVETADVVIQSDNLSRVADAISIGRRTHALVRVNITLALGIKVAVMVAGAFGLTSLWAAVLADTGVALLCVANTYFIRK